jgi:hypothetical protein
VKVTEDMVRVTEPEFQDTPTSIRRFVPVPLVTATLALLLLAAPVLL